MWMFAIKTIYYGLFIGIVTITLLLLASLFPIEGNFQIKSVLSGSMEPAIHTGSVVIIKSAPLYAVGDVITFGADNKQNIPVTHRIIEAKQIGLRESFKTKGDANGDPDMGTVQSTDVVGKVLFTVPYLGYLLEFTKQPAGFYSFVIVPAILIALGELFKIGKEVYLMWQRKKTHQVTKTNLSAHSLQPSAGASQRIRLEITSAQKVVPDERLVQQPLSRPVTMPITRNRRFI